MKKGTQRAMHCRCGNSKILAVGLCGTCYTLKRQDEEYFGGLREAVLKRDGHRCRVCGKPGGRKRSLAVHHRIAGKSELNLMITLCLAHHAMVTRTLVLLEDWPELLRVLWREQHPEAHEQTALNFATIFPAAHQTELSGVTGKANEYFIETEAVRPSNGVAICSDLVTNATLAVR